MRKLSPNDIAAQNSGIYFGDGWYAIEQYSPEEKFRWVDNDARVVVDLPSDPAPPLIVDLEPGPGVGRQPFKLEVRDAAGNLVAETIVSQRLRLELQLPGGNRRIAFSFHVPTGGAPTSDNPRIMNFRVFSCNWAVRPGAEAEPTVPRPEILAEEGPEREEYKAHRFASGALTMAGRSRFCLDSGGPVRALRAARSVLVALQALCPKSPFGTRRICHCRRRSARRRMARTRALPGRDFSLGERKRVRIDCHCSGGRELAVGYPDRTGPRRWLGSVRTSGAR